MRGLILVALLWSGAAHAVTGQCVLVVDGKTIGAIGVSGGTSAQDAQVAQAGVAAFEVIAKK